MQAREAPPLENRISRRLDPRWGPWLFGARLDLALFAGSALAALLFVGVGHVVGWSREPFPEWGWLLFVLGIDVAHVYSTLFRTYFDRYELSRHPFRYAAVPLVAYLGGVLLYRQGSTVFWRVLAYVALFHFIRQQAGWVAVYRARARTAASEGTSRFERPIDEAAIYLSMLYPVVHWHAHLKVTHFAWFVQGDFVDLSAWAPAALPFAFALWAVALALFFGRELVRLLRGRTVALGKVIVVAATALAWYVGIVATNSDFDFTVTNVIVHGVPYMGLLFVYAKERGREAGKTVLARVSARGIGAFLAVLVGLAFVEELGWDRFVWHDRGWLFGESESVSAVLLAVLVPLFAAPQLTHYLLDGFLWRRSDTRARPAQRAALGFEP